MQLNHDRRLSLKYDVAARGASDRMIKSQRMAARGYMAHFYLWANHFKNNLISTVHQKSYNG